MDGTKEYHHRRVIWQRVDSLRPEKIAWKRRGKNVLILVCLLAIIALPSLFTPPASRALAASLKPFPLQDYHRLLVLAPHCDDETLGSAGLILAAQRLGLQVRVVIATNGDGYYFATAQEFNKLYPGAADYIHMGEVRQQESLAALKILGVQAGQVSFLGYPDRGSPSEWNDHWSAQDPYRSPYSRDTRSPYPLTYDPKSVYAGEDYLADIMSILESYRPDLIVYPHADDVHPDHWGLNVFTRLAIAEVNHIDASFAPVQLTYLVHRPDFPIIKGLMPQERLVPPPALLDLQTDWFRWDLTPQDVVLKGKAVQAYRSQLPLLHGLMDSFVRTNELFASVEQISMPLVKAGDPLYPSTWIGSDGQPIPPVERDPVGDFFTRKVLPGGDLVSAYLARDPSNALWICSKAHEAASVGLTYRFRLKALTRQAVLAYKVRTGREQDGWKKAVHSGVYACFQISLEELGDPWVVFLGADVEGGGRLMDQTGWQLVYMGIPPSTAAISPALSADNLSRIIWASDPSLPGYDPASSADAEFSSVVKQISGMGLEAVDAADDLAVAIRFPRRDSYLAAQALLELGSDITATTLDLLIDNLFDEKPGTRIYSTILVGSLGKRAACAIGNVAPLLWDPDPSVRSSAALALDKITGNDLVPGGYEVVISPSFLAGSIPPDSPDGRVSGKARTWWAEKGSKVNWHPSYGLCDP
jgi:N-acetyl-1-D-myo-inositol-2-amino-2-deoxy-alpha-D-glucopyranoside deacetylase